MVLYGLADEERQKIVQSGGLRMNCNDFSSIVPAFLDDTLDNEELHAFLDHLDECKGCREELEIQYLVNRVFDEKSAGEELNLSKDLPAYINSERELLRKRRRLSMTAAVFETVALFTAVVTAILYIFI
jgi:predicted anti-sigma-YlaC factor YlaD